MRWITTIPMAVAAVLILIICEQQVAANAVFELQLQKFVNHLGKDNNGHCCSGFKKLDGKCSDTCLTKFRVCLKVYQDVIDPKSPCTFGEKITPVLGANEVNFSLLKDFINPLEFKLDSWQGTFSLIIEALHEVNNDTLYYDGPVLVSRLMTQQWLDVSANWKQDEHHSDHSTLQYKYRVVCQEHYHGEGCRKWCRPRDDNFGHYTCNKNGDRECLSGWQNPESYCNTAVCSQGCKGKCEKPNECKCPLGWEGPKCDKCVVYPGCLHGSCDEPWQCNCNEGWGGLFCNQDLNYCTNHHPCKNGATCFNTAPGSYSCQCTAGFNGTNCEIVNDSCANDPCKNGGTCLDTGDEGFVCQCRSGFTGRYCQLSGQSCADDPCQHGAPCTDTPTGFQCHCRKGFEGAMCERPVNDCASSPCLNGGSCVDEHTTYRCVCPVGYSGSRCQTNVDDCAHTPCLNGGLCLDGIDSFRCQCRAGFVGNLCQTNVDDCKTRPCANGGTCVDKINNFECHCRPGWGGRYCNEQVVLPPSPCASNPCLNGGACKDAVELSSGYRCFCPPGVLGPRCTVPHHHSQVQATTRGEDGEPPQMSALQVVLIVTFSVAVPLLALASLVAIVCMRRRRKRELNHHDEEARRQNERNAVSNAVNNKNHLTRSMIFNALDYPHDPSKPLNTEVQKGVMDTSDGGGGGRYPSKKNCGDMAPYSIVPAGSRTVVKTLNTDASRLSLASRLEKDLDAFTISRNSPVDPGHPGHPGRPGQHVSKTPDPHLPRTHSQGDVFTKRSSMVGSCGGPGGSTPSSTVSSDVCTSTHTLTSTCTPSTCTTPSSVYVIEEHLDENYIATEV